MRDLAFVVAEMRQKPFFVFPQLAVAVLQDAAFVVVAVAAEMNSVDHSVLGAIGALMPPLHQRSDDDCPRDECGQPEPAKSGVVGAKTDVAVLAAVLAFAAAAAAVVVAVVAAAAARRAAAAAAEWNVEKVALEHFVDLQVASVACNPLQSSMQCHYCSDLRKDKKNTNRAL